jgi:D-3-phosphoglycerate dehydrogenase
MKILVFGDSYVSSEVFARAFAALEPDPQLTYAQLDESDLMKPRTPSELSLREYAGSPRQLIERLPGQEVLVVHGAPVSDAVLDASGQLKLVCCARGGPVNIDLEAASQRRIPVVTTPGKNAESVADLAIAFMVMLARGIPKAQSFLEHGGRLGESAFEGAQFFGNDLGGHALGLVGYGNVGRRVARRAFSFGMSIQAYDPYLDPATLAEDGVTPLSTLASLLEQSNFVSLHARTSAENENLMSGPEFKRMQAGAFFINTARETLVDEEALLEAVSSRHLAGAALDVVRPHLGPGPHPLLELPNVVITPHIGGATRETLQRGAQMVAEEIGRFSRSEPLRWVINSVGAHT